MSSAVSSIGSATRSRHCWYVSYFSWLSALSLGLQMLIRCDRLSYPELSQKRQFLLLHCISGCVPQGIQYLVEWSKYRSSAWPRMDVSPRHGLRLLGPAHRNGIGEEVAGGLGQSPTRTRPEVPRCSERAPRRYSCRPQSHLQSSIFIAFLLLVQGWSEVWGMLARSGFGG